VTAQRRWRLALGAVGVAAAGYGGWGLLTGGVATAPRDTGRWLLAGVLAHDLVLAPLVAGTGWLLGRTVPAAARGTVQGGLFVAGTVTLVAIPVLSGRGGRSNPTTDPLDYPRNRLVVLAAVAVATAVLAAVRVRRARRPAGRSQAGH
jgi:hypothetical protein